MDVYCSTCAEPWDTHHLWDDAIFETGLSVEEAEAWATLPRTRKLSDRYRQEFRSAGWGVRPRRHQRHPLPVLSPGRPAQS